MTRLSLSGKSHTKRHKCETDQPFQNLNFRKRKPDMNQLSGISNSKMTKSDLQQPFQNLEFGKEKI